MLWKRSEEDMEVVVRYIPISDIPAGPADEIVGLWELVEKSDSFRGNVPKHLFLRPDKLFKKMGGSLPVANGFWHMNGHKPILALINNAKSVEKSSV